MSDLNLSVVVVAIAGLLVFISLPVKWKVLLAFIVMTQCFDLAPEKLFGSFVWDVGAILLLISAVQLALMKPKVPNVRAVSMTLLWIFLSWLLLCFVYSVVVNGYPVLNTVKVSRQMIIGYASVFIFLRVFRIDEAAFPTFMKWLYIFTFVLLLAAIIQYVTRTPILPGFLLNERADTSYRGALRYLPVFLPISLLYLWVIFSKFFQGTSVKIHEWIYVAMVVVIVATTYTRGIYIAVLISSLIAFFLLLWRGQLKVTSVAIFLVVASLVLTVLSAGGWADRVIGRAMSGLAVVMEKSNAEAKGDEDTFTGRLLLVKERFSLVYDKNPIFGFGFLHENDLPDAVRNKLRYGSAVSTPEMLEAYQHGHPYVLALYSVDIGWGDIALTTGFLGFFLFALFLAVFLFSYKKNKNNRSSFSHYQLAFFVQTITLLLLMFNGSPFTHGVQIPALMIAGYWYCSYALRAEARKAAAPNLIKGQ